MRLLRIPQAFDHPDFAYELKLDGFRALAFVDGGGCRLVSRHGHEFKRWPDLPLAVARSFNASSAVLDGEVVCLDQDGRSNFNALLFGRGRPFFCAFDLLMVDGEDLRRLPLLERKNRLRSTMPTVEGRLRYVDHIIEHGVEFFGLACERDLEGVVAKWAHGTYQQGSGTSWLKVKNPSYSQAEGRAELFEERGGRPERQVRERPVLMLT